MFSLVALALCACGGGGSSSGGAGSAPTPGKPETSNVVELKPTVMRIDDAQAKHYEVADGGVIGFAGSAAPPLGTVLILNGTAYKLVEILPTMDGKSRYRSEPPELEEVFDRLLVTADVSVAGIQSSGRASPALTLPFPETKLSLLDPDQSLGILADVGVKDGRVTAELDYSSQRGWTRKKLLFEGTITLKADLQLKRSNKDEPIVFPLAIPVNLPIPTTLGALSFYMPVEVAVTVKSENELRFGLFDGAWRTAVGLEKDPVSGEWKNLSSIVPLHAVSFIPQEASIASLVASLELNFSERWTPVSITVAPRISPSIFAFGAIGVVGARHELGVKGSLQINGLFPTRLDCTEVPFKVENKTSLFHSIRRFDSLFDFDGEEIETPMFSFKTEHPLHTFRFGSCVSANLTVAGAALPADPPANTPVTLSATVTVDTNGQSPTGRMDFLEEGGTTPLCSASVQALNEGVARAECTASFPVVGTRRIVAKFLGTGDFARFQGRASPGFVVHVGYCETSEYLVSGSYRERALHCYRDSTKTQIVRTETAPAPLSQGGSVSISTYSPEDQESRFVRIWLDGSARTVSWHKHGVLQIDANYLPSTPAPGTTPDFLSIFRHDYEPSGAYLRTNRTCGMAPAITQAPWNWSGSYRHPNGAIYRNEIPISECPTRQEIDAIIPWRLSDSLLYQQLQ
ncbi:Ig-like domain-containing protein [Uliginosibacterium sp. H1]|uniref:Ig-like domain-containing protein n=1 Tax=Uliginosibacterium sp. H1 TaxID=3114757 RepID=UPI002E171D3E|nr:Ig-like domain-containing protein [Uliginosibacterium sp. H1]